MLHAASSADTTDDSNLQQVCVCHRNACHVTANPNCDGGRETHLGGVGAMRTVRGKVTLDRLTSVLPGAGGDTMVKDTSPLAMSSTAAASGSTLMKRARKPDQGHSTELYSNFTLRYCPATLVLLNTGAPSKRPALHNDINWGDPAMWVYREYQSICKVYAIPNQCAWQLVWQPLPPCQGSKLQDLEARDSRNQAIEAAYTS